MIPADRWQATPASGPASEPLAHSEWPSRSRTAVVAANGCVTVEGYIIHVGVEHHNRAATILIDDLHANVFIDGQLIRHIDLDPDRRYQSSGKPRGGQHRRRLAS